MNTNDLFLKLGICKISLYSFIWPMSNPLVLTTVSLVYLIRFKWLMFLVNATKKDSKTDVTRKIGVGFTLAQTDIMKVLYSYIQYTHRHQFEWKFAGGNKASTEPLGWSPIVIYGALSLGKEPKRLNVQYEFP